MNKSSKTVNLSGEILSSALQKAPDMGWSPRLLTALKQEFGIVEMTRHYPRGLIDLAQGWADWADHEMLAALETDEFAQMKIREKIAHGVRARLTALTPHKAAFKASFKYLMNPLHAGAVKDMTWQTADRLWYAAGDDATDYNHYSKRLLLSGVLASTTLYWMRDTSENHEKTWAFLNRRIDNVLKFGGLMNKFKKRRA